MTRPDPAWMGWADRAMRLVMRAYPARIRALHGEEMRQAFRDRCRDFAAGRIGAWRLFAREWLFDSARAAVGAHLEAGIGPLGLRHAGLLALLLVTGVLLVRQDDLVAPVVREAVRAKKLWPLLAEENRRRRDEARVRELGEALVAGTRVDDRALGAWLLAANPARRLQFTPRRPPDRWIERWFYGGSFYAALPAQGRAATAVALATGDGATPFALAAAAAACHPRFGCMDADLLRRLAQADAGNAHAAFHQFKSASRAGDDAGMSVALARAAVATRHDDYQAQFRRRTLRAAIALHPADDAFLMAIGRTVNALRDSDASGWDDDIRSQCFPGDRGWPDRPTFLERHPGRRADCTAVARLVSNSTNPLARQYGRQLEVALGVMDPDEARRMDQAWRDWGRVGWSRVQASREDPPGIRWTAAEWAAWARREAAGADG